MLFARVGMITNQTTTKIEHNWSMKSISVHGTSRAKAYRKVKLALLFFNCIHFVHQLRSFSVVQFDQKKICCDIICSNFIIFPWLQLLKPEVERFRRERMNSSLESLRAMLLHWPQHQVCRSSTTLASSIKAHSHEVLWSASKEKSALFISTSPLQGLASKRVEKAEILEQAVTFLKGYGDKRGGGMEQTFQDGYTTCLQKAADFLRNSGQNGDKSGDEAQRRAFAVQLTHLDRCAATPVPTLSLTRCGAPPTLIQYQQPGLLALQRQRHSSKAKLSPRAHSAKIMSPPLINSQALWRPWPWRSRGFGEMNSEQNVYV